MRILIVDDDPDILDGLGDSLEHLGHTPHLVASAEEAWEKLQKDPPDLLLLDLTLPGMDGMSLLKKISDKTTTIGADKKNHTEMSGYTYPPVIVMTAFGTIEKAVNAMKFGAFDFLPKPFDIDHLCLLMARAFERASLEQQVEYLRQEVESPYSCIIGSSTEVENVKELARQAAETNVMVLLLGETGTGKELFARTIHRWSLRSRGPFMVINCAGMPETLLENELFGHERGAFTGADRQRQGRIEAAAGGTVLLDEIGDMPMGLQTRLLRVLQDREFHRIGGVKSIEANVRFIAATNKNLWEAVKEKTFREDLYFRLNVLTIRLPPLRERAHDIYSLAEYFMKRHIQTFRKQLMQLTPEAIRQLQEYSWPGNIRELDNILARAVVINKGKDISTLHLQLPSQETTIPLSLEAVATHRSYQESVNSFTQVLIRTALKEANGNKTLAAKRLQLSRTYFARLLKRKNIRDIDELK